MTWTRAGISVAAAAGTVSTVLATSVIWMLLTNPAAIAVTCDGGTTGSVAREVVSALIDALCDLLAYL